VPEEQRLTEERKRMMLRAGEDAAWETYSSPEMIELVRVFGQQHAGHPVLIGHGDTLDPSVRAYCEYCVCDVQITAQRYWVALLR
jgi:hypothetical protein